MHIAERLVFRTLLIVAMSFLTSCRITHHSPFEDDLEKIDAALNMADEYVHAKEQKIRTIENMLNSRGVNDLQKYHIYGQLFEEYEAYQFDKAKEMLENQEEIAECLGNLITYVGIKKCTADVLHCLRDIHLGDIAFTFVDLERSLYSFT